MSKRIKVEVIATFRAPDGQIVRQGPQLLDKATAEFALENEWAIKGKKRPAKTPAENKMESTPEKKS